MNLVSIGSDNGLSPTRRQAIIWTNVGILLIRPLGTNFSEIGIGIQTLSLKKLRFKMSSAKRRRFCPGGDELIDVSKSDPGGSLGQLDYLIGLSLPGCWYSCIGFTSPCFLSLSLIFTQNDARIYSISPKTSIWLVLCFVVVWCQSVSNII